MCSVFCRVHNRLHKERQAAFNAIHADVMLQCHQCVQHRRQYSAAVVTLDNRHITDDVLMMMMMMMMMTYGGLAPASLMLERQPRMMQRTAEPGARTRN